MRGDFPLELLDAALACHSRIILPMAPAEGLFLSRTRFFPFRTSFNRDFTVSGFYCVWERPGSVEEVLERNLGQETVRQKRSRMC